MTLKRKALKYRRVSSKDQEKGYSLDAQDELMDSYAKKHGYDIVGDFCEAETAKRAGRKLFNDMIKYIRNHPDVRVILAEKTDRIYRNLKDYLTLDEFKDLEVHLIKENTIISEKSTSHEKFIHGIKVLMAKNYVDNLSEEVIKGQTKKAKENIYPSTAPIGYVNDEDPLTRRRVIFIDKERAPFIKRAFELYATGDYSSLYINNLMYKEGLRTRKGNKFSKAAMERMFKNIFYTGRFTYKGITCDDAQHDRLISDDTFNIIQERLGTQIKARSHTVEFPYSNMIQCGVCGGFLTAELKKGRYVYYHCSDYHRQGCKKDSYINQDKIDKAIMELLSRFDYSDKFVQDVLGAVIEIHEKKNNYNHETVSSINKQIETIQRRIERAYVDKVDGNIPEEFWKSQNRIWHAEKDELYERLKKINEFDNQFYTNAETLLKWCKNSHDIFKKGTAEDKRFIAKIVLSNMTYKDKKLSLEPYSLFFDMLKVNAQKSTIELAETQTTHNKKAHLSGLFVNGGGNDANIELSATKYYNKANEIASCLLEFIQKKESTKILYHLKNSKRIA